jgi:hypothetical protein
MVIPLALLTACGGGGGGKGGSLPPAGNTPQSKKAGTATFSFKLPGKNTMARVRRPYYQSQATQGVGIDWVSSNPTSPDYAAPISAACPLPASLPPGVVSCTIDAQGNTDYSFQVQIPAGTYPNFTVTTFDQAPASGGTFVVSANMLAQGQLAAPVVIVAGQANTIPNLTFYGVPASVSFQPGPAQSHVVMYGGNLSVIGNQAQTFYSQAVDADGFAISSNDSGAPAITVAEAASDNPKMFTVATTANPYAFTMTAINASGNASIVVTATPGGTGLSPVTNNVTVMPAQELWTTLEAGSNPVGIYGYPVYSSGTITSGPIDGYADPIGNALCGGGGSECNFQIAAIDPSSGTIYAVGINSSDIPGVYPFMQSSTLPSIVAPSGAAFTEPAGATITSMAVDAQHHGYLVDNNSGNVSVEAYSTAASGWSAVTTSNDSQLTTFAAESVAAAPAAANVPNALVGSLWVGTAAGTFLVYPAFSGTFGAAVAATAPSTVGEVLGFDSAGYLWICDGTNVYVAKISGTTSSPTLTVLGQTALAQGGATGTSFGAAAGQAMWLGRGTGEETGFDLYTATCGGSSCSIAVASQSLPTSAASFAAFVTP